MKNFVGIDLGTTNSAICSYDGAEVRVWKSPEQNGVTPSAIYIGKRGNKYIGRKAYEDASRSPDNVAKDFKRFMGTSTPIPFPAVDIVKTPEECSSEVLKTLFGYLPEEMRNHSETGTVITVPAAFNQMQKDATMEAAEMAGLGMVALMQEPVAAVMSVMRKREHNGMFLIYDLGGGTLDIAIAESLGGHVNLLAHGGIARCGGRDFDRLLVDNVVRPWLHDNFDLPEDFLTDPKFKFLLRLSVLAAEKSKMELSAKEETQISLFETDINVRDLAGAEIYLQAPLSRDVFDNLIANMVAETIDSARTTLDKAGLSPNDMDCIVFIGGPTNYKPFRDKVTFELGIGGNLDVNPMTAVAEGASLFAESIDWSNKSRPRKSLRGQVAAGGELALTFNYVARTPDSRAKIAVQMAGKAPTGAEFQIDNLDTAWSSGRFPLEHGAVVDVTLANPGENTFKAFVFDSTGGVIELEQDRIIITRTAATVDAIPASHSIGVEVRDKIGGPISLEFLVKEGDTLPKKGRTKFKTEESLKAGSSGAININLWEGDNTDDISDNRPIGALKISGTDFVDDVIPAGADILCEYEVLDSGALVLEVSVPSIHRSFTGNFYSRQAAPIDYAADAARVMDEGERTLKRIEEIGRVVDDPKLDKAREKARMAAGLDKRTQDPEKNHEAMEAVLCARQLLKQVKAENLPEIRQVDLDDLVQFFDKYIREHARPSEAKTFDTLTKTAQRAIDNNSPDFEHYLDELKRNNFAILWRQDWFVVEKFKAMSAAPYLFADRRQFDHLVHEGIQCIGVDDIEKLRTVVGRLHEILVRTDVLDDMSVMANIIRGG